MVKAIPEFPDDFTTDQLRLIVAMCSTAMMSRKPEEYFEPWKGTYETAQSQIKWRESTE